MRDPHGVVGLAGTQVAEVEGNRQARDSRRAVGIGKTLAGLHLQQRQRLAGWLVTIQSSFSASPTRLFFVATWTIHSASC